MLARNIPHVAQFLAHYLTFMQISDADHVNRIGSDFPRVFSLPNTVTSAVRLLDLTVDHFIADHFSIHIQVFYSFLNKP